MYRGLVVEGEGLWQLDDQRMKETLGLRRYADESPRRGSLRREGMTCNDDVRLYVHGIHRLEPV
jgi:hypothetical protein